MHSYEQNWLVESVERASRLIEEAGGHVVTAPFEIPVGRVAIAADPFGNVLVLVELSKGRYTTNDAGDVIAVEAEAWELLDERR